VVQFCGLHCLAAKIRGALMSLGTSENPRSPPTAGPLIIIFRLECIRWVLYGGAFVLYFTGTTIRLTT
jgi:hypothetical protein